MKLNQEPVAESENEDHNSIDIIISMGLQAK